MNRPYFCLLQIQLRYNPNLYPQAISTESPAAKIWSRHYRGCNRSAVNVARNQMFSGNSRPPRTPEGVGGCGPWVTHRSPTATTSLSLGSRLPQTLSRCTFANVFHERFHGSTPFSVGINQAAALLLQKNLTN